MVIDKKVRTRICTKDYFLREGIVSLLRSADYEVAEETGDEAHDDCDIVVLCLDPRSTVLDAVGPLLLSAPRAKIVVLAHLHEGGALPRQVLTRAAAILDRGITSRKLLVALEAVMSGVVVHDPAVLRGGQDVLAEDTRDEGARAAPAARPAGLAAMIPAALPLTHTFSSRERDILAALMEGLPNKVIARRYDIAEATVKVHVKHILRKLNMSNRTQAAIWVKSNAAMVA